MHSHTIKIKNGDYLQDYSFYNCDRCKKLMEEAWPIFKNGHKDHCPTCAFELGLIESKEYVDNVGGFSSSMFKAEVNPTTKQAEMTFLNSKFSWQRKNKEYRKTKQYSEWRTSVFERDKYTCQECDQIGGNLEAHHIKPFATYEKQRYRVGNGVTLCKKCHKARHKRLKLEGAKYG